jgi:acyl-coenzyme A synthetase/AMP-(fatty) acid ligase
VLRHPYFEGLPRARVSFVRQLPRNANGKVVRAEVRRLDSPPK